MSLFMKRNSIWPREGCSWSLEVSNYRIGGSQADRFFVGNHYYIRNMKDYDAKLFFVQGRLMTTDDFEGSRAGTARAERSPSRARAFEDSGGAVRSSSKGDGLGSSSPQKRPAQRPKPGASAISSSRR
jgi:hypothetical protein